MYVLLILCALVAKPGVQKQYGPLLPGRDAFVWSSLRSAEAALQPVRL